MRTLIDSPSRPGFYSVASPHNVVIVLSFSTLIFAARGVTTFNAPFFLYKPPRRGHGAEPWLLVKRMLQSRTQGQQAAKQNPYLIGSKIRILPSLHRNSSRSKAQMGLLARMEELYKQMSALHVHPRYSPRGPRHQSTY